MFPPVEGAYGHGRKTETAGTAIVSLVPGKKGKFTYIVFVSYLDAGTAHTITQMRAIGTGTLSAAAAASQAVVVATAQPVDSAGATVDTVAANDYLAIQKPNGDWHLAKVSSVSSLSWTLTANVPTGGFNAGARYCFYGVVGDSYHDDFDLVSGSGSALKNFPPVSQSGVMCKSTGPNEPILIYSDNATNAGKLEHVSAIYSRVG